MGKITEEIQQAGETNVEVLDTPQEVAAPETKSTMQIDEARENAELLKLYRRILRKAKPLLKEGDSRQIKKAFMFAAHAHRDQRRKSGEPYIFHPVNVALIVAEEIGLDATSIIAAFLHDVVEDTEYTLKDIEDKFGKTVANIIDGLTKMSATTRMNTSMQAENFRKMLLTIAEDVRVVLVKIADRLHNMRTLDGQPKHKQMKIRSETAYIYAPLAHRLGLYSIKSELEDLGLMYSDPEAYNSIKQKIEETKTDRARFFRSFNRPIKMDLDKAEFGYTMKMREKSVYSIYRKMQKQDIPFEQVYDYFAVRIILKDDFKDRKAEKAACWSVFSIITDHYTSNTKRLRDWVSMPRDNGYESLHITVMGPTGSWVEVQVRTERMDQIAEKGLAAHWRYKEQKKGKSNKKGELGIDSWISKVREMLEKKEEINAAEFLEDFRGSLYAKEVYAFTPKGEVKTLAMGASVLDFAFEIHTEVGARCMAAKVNGKLVPLHYQIKSGDQIEIITSKVPKANDSWLKHVVTSKAKTKIKEYLKEDRKRIAMLGKEIVQRKFKQMKLPMNDQNAFKIAQFFGYKTETDFYYDVGQDIVDHTEIKKFKEHLNQESNVDTKKIRPNNANEFKEGFKKAGKKEDELVIGEDMDKLDYSLAQCCNPIPGDGIFGYITVGKGIKIHRTTCKNAPAMLAHNGHRVIKAKWASSKDEEFSADLLIEGIDRMGLVNDVTKIISNQMKVNIKSIQIGAESGVFKGRIALSVHDKDELENLIENIRNIESVFRVTRMEEKV